MKISYRVLALALLLAVGFISFTTFEKSLDIIKVDGGRISGTVNPSGDIHIFKGIPFAAPPIGPLRWKEPQALASWKGVRACTAFGPSPMQNKPVPFSYWSEEFLIPKEPISEDCLYLNVWTGAKSSREKHPVMVYIYGGGFSSGGSAVPIYDGEAMAKKGIVFVSINYRVGVFGFFAHPELTRESGKNASGNYGIMDQLAALRWVQRNISSFGGDPRNVTIAGQSAGSFSVNALVASPLGKNLFRRAICESGASFTNPVQTLAKAEEEGVRVAQSLKASSLADLRNIPAEELQKKSSPFRGIIVDGYVLPESVSSIFAAGRENQVDLLTGWNQNEGLLFGQVKTAENFKKDAAQKYGADASTFLLFYPAATDSEASASQYNLSRDMIFGVQNYVWANLQSDHGAAVYVYRFTHRVPGVGAAANFGAFHTGEVPYAYNNLRMVNRPWGPADSVLADRMSSYWANFTATGNPNGKGLPDWPAYSVRDKKIMKLDSPPAAESIPDAAALDFLKNNMTGH
jgi:para-nitrobenzyl esterase